MAGANPSTFTLKYDLTGKAFGRLVAISYASGGKWVCRCECGREATVYTTSLVQGRTTSCGCTWHAVNARRTHGLTDSAEYKVWCGIKRRCFNSNEKSYADYGGRGITMCDRWANSFEAFIEDMGRRPSDQHQIDRIHNDKDYCKDNCQWSERKRQCRNRRSSAVLDFRGERKTIAEWAEVTGIQQSTISYRINSGWPIDKALTTPVA